MKATILPLCSSHCYLCFLCCSSIIGVDVLIAPATAQNVSEQHVRCTLVAAFPAGYPTVMPNITIKWEISYCYSTVFVEFFNDWTKCNKYVYCFIIVVGNKTFYNHSLN